MAQDYFAQLGTKPRESLPGPNGTVVRLSASSSSTTEGETKPKETEPAVPETQPTPAVVPEDKPGEEETGKPEGEEPGAGPAESGDPAPMDREQRREQAAARREREFNARLETEREKIVDEAVAAMGFTDPYSGKPIKTRAELEVFNRARADKELSESLEGSGIDPQIFNRLISNHPEIVHAREVAQAAETERRRALDTSEQSRAAAELAEIQKIDPKIKSVTDLAALDNYGEIYELVAAGTSISKAYKLVNQEAILAKERAATRQAVLNEISGKGHLQATQQQGGAREETPVTQTDRVRFQQMHGRKLTDTEIRTMKEKLYGKKG